MSLTDYVGSILLTDDQYLSVSASAESVVDDMQLGTQNAHIEMLLPCIRDRYAPNTLLYDTRNHITLQQYLESAQFTEDAFRQLLLHLLEAVDALAGCGLPQTNLLLDPTYIYIDVVNQRIKLVYLPLRTSLGIEETMGRLSALLRGMIGVAKVTEGHMLFGLVLSHTNSELLDLVRFYTDLREFERITVRRSPKQISRVMLAWIFTMLLMAASVVGVPLWGVLTDELAVTQFIDLFTVYYIALLFLVGLILSCLTSLLLRETKRRKKKRAPMPKAKVAKPSKKKKKNTLAAPASSPQMRTDAPLAIPTEQKQGAWLQDEQGGQMALVGESCALGRDETRVQLVVTEAGVSGLHAVFMHGERGWTVRDEQSRNGTYLNGNQLASGENVPLGNGDQIAFADAKRTFFVG